MIAKLKGAGLSKGWTARLPLAKHKNFPIEMHSLDKSALTLANSTLIVEVQKVIKLAKLAIKLANDAWSHKNALEI